MRKLRKRSEIKLLPFGVGEAAATSAILISTTSVSALEVLHLHSRIANPHPSMTRHDPLANHGEHVRRSLRSNHELRLASFHRAENTCGSVEGD
jgi:hypothetical protein